MSLRGYLRTGRPRYVRDTSMRAGPSFRT
jgi:hypothetical protein